MHLRPQPDRDGGGRSVTAAKGVEAVPQPYTVSQGAVPMLCVGVNAKWVLLPYIHLTVVTRVGPQIVATFGDFEVRILVMANNKWSVDDMRLDFMQQRIMTLQHDDKNGLSLTVVKIVQGEDQVEVIPVI